ncbi:hypothetical protein [Microbacterium halophytorum]|uniref:hypothetical protein n=1 Tax=Microbacterium halophytorum TaxID=2067568 RepID=UPI000CFB8F84|nr:hypothetical protein [Microbacterium halophytorum]
MGAQHLSAAAAAAFAGAAYGALLVCAAGVVTLWTDAPVIDVPGLGVVPAMLAAVAAVFAFAGALHRAVRPPRPAYTAAIGVALTAALAHLVSLWLFAVLLGSGLGVAGAAVAGSVTGGFSVLAALLAAACAWAGVALRRTDADRPRWPWERRGE